jgi:hypothetical protein
MAALAVLAVRGMSRRPLGQASCCSVLFRGPTLLVVLGSAGHTRLLIAQGNLLEAVDLG